jgi:hypothetical protein
VEFDESGQELDENSIQAFLHGICNADASAEDAIAEFDRKSLWHPRQLSSMAFTSKEKAIKYLNSIFMALDILAGSCLLFSF